jgi:FkbM family methyltransferase
MIRRIYDISLLLARQDITKGEKLKILLQYYKVIFFHFLSPAKKIHSFLGFLIKAPSFFNLEQILREVFIFGDYACKTDSSAPRIIDCGGNIGITTLFYKHYYPQAKITAFEPMKDAFDALKFNTSGLKDVEIINAAVSREDGEITFWELPNNPGGSTASPDVFKTKGKRLNFSETKAKAVKLSNYIKEPVDILKIDIEGSEGNVFEDLVSNKKISLIKDIVFEYHYNPKNLSNKLSRIIDLLESSGFKVIIYGTDFGVSGERVKIDSYHFMIRASRI